MNPSISSHGLSRVQSGAALAILAVALGWTRWFPGASALWSVVLIGLGAAVLSNRWPDLGQSTLNPLLTLLVVAHAFHLWYFGLGWLPWLLAAWMLAASQWQRLDWAVLRGGYRLYIPIGIAVCLFSLLSTWQSSADHWSFGWMGGMQLQNHFNPFTGSLELRSTYNPIMYPNNYWWPGFDFSGRALNGAILVEIALWGILAWAAWRDGRAQFQSRALPLIAIALIAIWALPSAKASFAAPHWFLLGLALCGFGVWKASSGQNRGNFDPSDVAQRVRRRFG